MLFCLLHQFSTIWLVWSASNYLPFLLWDISVDLSWYRLNLQANDVFWSKCSQRWSKMWVINKQFKARAKYLHRSWLALRLYRCTSWQFWGPYFLHTSCILVSLLPRILRSRVYLSSPTWAPDHWELLDMLKEYEWLTFRGWSQLYSTLMFELRRTYTKRRMQLQILIDITQVNVAEQFMTVIDTLETTMELLKRRAHIYSSKRELGSYYREKPLIDIFRPQLTIFHELWVSVRYCLI